MDALNSIVDYLFFLLAQIANLITNNWILLLFFSLGILRLIVGVFYNIKKRGGL